MSRRRVRRSLGGVLATLLVAAVVGSIVLFGTVSFDAESVVTLNLYDTGGASVSYSGFKTDADYVYFVPAAPAAVVELVTDVKVKELQEQGNAIVIDLQGLEVETGVVWAYWRLTVTDGTNEVILGTFDEDELVVTARYDKDDLAPLDEFQTAKVRLKFYDDAGNLVNLTAASVESQVGFKVKAVLDTSSIAAFFTSAFMMVSVALRRAFRAVGGTIASGVAAIVSNNGLIVIAIGLAILMLTSGELARRVRKLW